MKQLDLKAIEARCEALDERLGKKAWTLEGPSHGGYSMSTTVMEI